jgi:hypothetical protein
MMEKEKDPLGKKNGLSDRTPLGSRIGMVQVAVRPPDPVLMERIADRFKELAEKGIQPPSTSSIAIRSVDGFYFISMLERMVKGLEPKIVSVVNYDPARRTFILSGSGEVNDLCELIWYAFEAFTSDSVIFHDAGSEIDLRAPDQMDERVSFNISKLQIWKDDPILEDGSRLLWRGKGIDQLIDLLMERY